jgi:hypothetical protein
MQEAIPLHVSTRARRATRSFLQALDATSSNVQMKLLPPYVQLGDHECPFRRPKGEEHMACELTPSTTAREDFNGNSGSTVSVKLKGPAGKGAEIVHIRYAGTEIVSQPPFQFTIRKGAKMLVVLAEASEPGVLLQFIEECTAGGEQVLDRFHFDPMNPARGYIVRGA